MQTVIDKISLLQRKAVRLMTFSNFDAHSEPLFKELKILKIKDNIFLQNCLFVHDYFHGNLPKSFNNTFTEVENTHTSFNNTFTEVENTHTSFNNTFTEVENTHTSFNNTFTEVENTHTSFTRNARDGYVAIPSYKLWFEFHLLALY